MTLQAYILHLRPRSWPVVFAHYLCGALILLPKTTEAVVAEVLAKVLFGGILWTVCLNGGTLALNSAFDRDVGDIGYLDNPPPIPRHLALFSLLLLVLGLILAWPFLPSGYCWLLAFCVILSILYSVPPIRLKAIGGFDLLVNMIGYGGATFAAGGAATGLLTQLPPHYQVRLIFLAVGFALLFGAFYPMTQIYQIPEDTARGDRTLAILLGPRRSLSLAVLLQLLALGCFAWGMAVVPPLNPQDIADQILIGGSGPSFLVVLPHSYPALGLLFLVLPMTLWVVFTLDWRGRLSTYPAKRGMYRALWLWALTDLMIVLACFVGTPFWAIKYVIV